MSRDFFPRRDLELVTWTGIVAAKLQADRERYGVPADVAADYIARSDAFVTAYRANADPGTMTRVGTSLKNDARRELEQVARKVNRLVHATADTPGVLIDLGLNVNKPGRGAKIGRPTVRPVLQVMNVSGRRVHLRMAEDAATVFYRKPRGVASAVIFTWVGEGLPDASSAWTYGGTTSTVNVKFTMDDPALQPGSRVWFAAAWVNPRGQQGPMSDARDAYLQHGMTMPSLQQAA